MVYLCTLPLLNKLNKYRNIEAQHNKQIYERTMVLVVFNLYSNKMILICFSF